MEITDVRFRKLLLEGKMKAIVSITLDNAFVVHDVKVVEGQNGLFVAMPSRRTLTGEFRDVAHPISREARAVIQDRVLAEYAAELERVEAEGESAPPPEDDLSQLMPDMMPRDELQLAAEQ